jgi:hypothetical protein
MAILTQNTTAAKNDTLLVELGNKTLRGLMNYYYE